MFHGHLAALALPSRPGKPAALQAEVLALRHQIGVLQLSSRRRPRLTPADRLFWAAPARVWVDWRSALLIVKPETVIG